MKAFIHIVKYPLVILFLTVLVLPSLNTTFRIWEFERKDENRAFRDTLDFDLTNLDKFPGEFEEYYNDNFSFRGPLLDAYHFLKYEYFKVSPNPEKTLIGNKGWYYSAGKEIDIFEGKLNFSKLDLRKFLKIWNERFHYLDSMGIQCYWVICPMKHQIYPEFLPLTISTHNEIKRVDQLLALLDEKYPGMIIDPTPHFWALKDSVKLYYQLDNHWNSIAGYETSQLLLSNIKNDFPGTEIPEIPEYEWTDSVVSGGIHYRVMAQDHLSEIQRFPLIDHEVSTGAKRYGFPAKKGFAYAWKYEMRYVAPSSKEGLTALFIRDSFGDALIPFIKESFKESVFIFDSWQYGLNKSIIETVKPDIIVYISYETHLDSFIK